MQFRNASPSTDVWTPRLPAGSGPADHLGIGPDELALVSPDAASAQPSVATVAPLPWAARIYVSAVILLGLALVLLQRPHGFPDPTLSVGLLALVVVTSGLKVSLPIPKTTATMSVSFVADFMALILLGPAQAMIFAAIGALAQCLVNRPAGHALRLYRVLFSMSALAITVQATNLVYSSLGGHPGLLDPRDLVKPIVGGAIAYFLCNTILVASAGALATRQSPLRVWSESFLWSAPSYFVGGGVAVAAAWLVNRGEVLFAPMVAAPVYLTYLTYKVYLGRMEDERRHVEEISAMHVHAMRALDMAQRSERALAVERERLAVTLGTIGEAVVASDTRGRVVLLNQTAELFTGWSQDEAVGLACRRGVPVRRSGQREVVRQPGGQGAAHAHRHRARPARGLGGEATGPIASSSTAPCRCATAMARLWPSCWSCATRPTRSGWRRSG